MPTLHKPAWITTKVARQVGLALALVLFVGGVIVSARAVPNLPERIELLPIALLLILGAPVTMVLGTVEFMLTARAAGRPITWRSAVEVTIYSNATNLLFAPAAYATKLAALKAHGVALKRGSASMILFAALWGGLAFLYAAAALAVQLKTELSVIFLTVSLALLIAAAVGFRRLGAAWSAPGTVAAMRLVSFPIEAFRYLLALWAVGSAAGFAQASVLVAGSFLGMIVGIVPAGLGVRELVVGAMSPLVDVAPEIGFLAAALGRVVWMIGQAAVSAVVLLAMRRMPA